MTGSGRPPPRRHRLSSARFESLAAGGADEAAIAELLRAERSWRLLILKEFLAAARAVPGATGPLPPVAAAWDLLARVESHHPAVADELVRHPQAGTWAGYALRRLRGRAYSDTPLWVDLGYLHCLAASAAIRAGLEFTMPVPAREGYVVLPTLGAARFDRAERWALAEVRRAGGTTTVTGPGGTVTVPDRPAPDRPGWIDLPTIQARAGGAALAVRLDHLDPYRDLRGPTPPAALSPVRLDRWRALLTEAWRMLVATCPAFADPLRRGLFSVVPQPAVGGFRGMSASAGDAFGALVTAEPRDAVELAATLVHEFQHIKLGAVLHLTTLQEEEPAQPLYAPWRDDPRPLSGLLQGVYAFTGVTEFWRAFRHRAGPGAAPAAEFEFARLRRQVRWALAPLPDLPQLTGVGGRLLAGLAGTAATWPAEPVPAEVDAAAGAAAADHRARWRLFHLRPDPAVVEELATGFVAGTGPPPVAYPPPAVVADPAASLLDTMTVLIRLRLLDPPAFAGLRTGSPDAERVAGATPADAALAAGATEEALAGYTADLATDPDRPGAWAGLGGVAAGRGDPAAAALRDRPELVRAVHRRAGELAGAPPDRLTLAAWLAAAGGRR